MLARILEIQGLSEVRSLTAWENGICLMDAILQFEISCNHFKFSCNQKHWYYLELKLSNKIHFSFCMILVDWHLFNKNRYSFKWKWLSWRALAFSWISGNHCPFVFQVGLLGMGRSLQKDLNRIAEVADTSTTEGLSYVLTGKLNICWIPFSLLRLLSI